MIRKIGLVLASLSLSLGPTAVLAAPSAARSNGSCAEAIDVVVSSGYRRNTLYCNGAVRSNTWRVHHTAGGCRWTDVTFYNSGGMNIATLC